MLRYIRGTIEYGILFPALEKQSECKLVGYTYIHMLTGVVI